MPNHSSSTNEKRHNARSWFSFRNSSAGAEVYLYGEIDPTFGISALDFISELQRLGPKEPFTLRINSPGGDVTEGFAVFNALARHQGNITVEIDGLAGSIASVIAMIGNPVRMAGNAYLMIHEAWGAAMGVSEDMRSLAETLAKMTDTIISTYQKKTNLPREQIAELLAAETWLNATEAKQLGFVDEITEPLRAAASIRDFDLTEFRNAPQQFTQPIFKEKNNMQTPATENEIKAQADELYKAKLNRDKEIDDTASLVLKRDRKDFSALATKFKREDKSVDEFCRAVATSDDFRAASGHMIGSGDERIVARDDSSLGARLVNDEGFRAIVQRNAGILPQGSRIQIPIEDRLTVRPRAALTTGSLDFGIDQKQYLVPLPQQRLYVSDLMTNTTTDGKTVRYLRENFFTNAALTVAEGVAKPQAALDIAKKDAVVEKIAAYIKVGDETISDFAQIRMLVDMRLPYMVQLTEEAQLLNGDGTGTNLTGIMQTSGLQSVALGGPYATRPDLLFHAITLIRRIAFLEPDGIVMHPTDFETIRTLKDANNQYMGGGPFTGAYGEPYGSDTGIPPRQYASIWGLPTVVTVSQPQGTVLVGAFKLGATVFRRWGLSLQVGYDADDFTKNLVTIRCEERLTVGVYFPNAFVTCTGF